MGLWEDEDPMLPVNGARSEVADGSSGSTSNRPALADSVGRFPEDHTIIQKIIIKDRVVIVKQVGVVARCPTGHHCHFVEAVAVMRDWDCGWRDGIRVLNDVGTSGRGSCTVKM